MKKYAFLGSHGVGKSSAAYYLAAHLKKKDPAKSVIVLEENIREIVKYTAGVRNTEFFQKLVFHDHMLKQLKAESMYDIIIMDRTCLDSILYRDHFVDDYDDLPSSDYRDMAIDELLKIDHIFLVKADSDFIANDNFRDTDINFRNSMEKEFELVLELNEVPYQVITTSQVHSQEFLKDVS